MDILLQRIYGKSKIIIKESPPKPEAEKPKEEILGGDIPKKICKLSILSRSKKVPLIKLFSTKSRLQIPFQTLFI